MGMNMKKSKSALVGQIIAGLISALFLFSAYMKLTSNPQLVENWPKMGWEKASFIAIGIVELVSVVIYLIPITSVVGAILLTGFLGGAIAAHVRVGEGFIPHIFFGIAIWASLYLRDSRLRELIPLRKNS
jgi:hypothetical protein